MTQENEATVHDLMKHYVDRGDVPGVVTAVSGPGGVHVDVLGTMAVGGAAPLAHDSIFRISSMTKPITAAATLVLVEEGAVRIDEPVDRLLPEPARRRVLRQLDGPLDDTVPAERPIQVRDLLTFTMGLVFAPPGTYPIRWTRWQ